jgi:hypothetical protein
VGGDGAGLFFVEAAESVLERESDTGDDSSSSLSETGRGGSLRAAVGFKSLLSSTGGGGGGSLLLLRAAGGCDTTAGGTAKVGGVSLRAAGFESCSSSSMTARSGPQYRLRSR